MHRTAQLRTTRATADRAALRLLCSAFVAQDRLRSERGATMTEYGLLLGFVAVVVFGGLALFGPAVVDLFTDTHQEFSDRRAPAAP